MKYKNYLWLTVCTISCFIFPWFLCNLYHRFKSGSLKIRLNQLFFLKLQCMPFGMFGIINYMENCFIHFVSTNMCNSFQFLMKFNHRFNLVMSWTPWKSMQINDIWKEVISLSYIALLVLSYVQFFFCCWNIS